MGNIFESGVEGLKDFAIGREGEVSTQNLDLLTPEQRQALIDQLSNGPVSSNGVTGLAQDQTRTLADGTTENASEVGLALDDVASLRSKIAGGKAQQAFTDVADRAGDSDAQAEFFKQQLAPLQEVAQESLQTVGRDFSGSGGFFGSERQTADEGVQRAFAGAQSKLMSDLINQDQDRALQAATGLAGQEGQQLQALQVQLQSALAAGNMEQVAQIQNQQAQIQAQQLYQQLLGVQSSENVVTATSGSNGALGGIIGSVAGAFTNNALGSASGK